LTRMRTSGGKRFDSSAARERCGSNGPQGEPRSGESSSGTDQIQKNPTLRLGFLLSASAQLPDGGFALSGLRDPAKPSIP